MITLKSLRGVHIVYDKGKPIVFATLIEALKYSWGAKR